MNGATARGEWDGTGWVGVFRLDWKTEDFKVRHFETGEVIHFGSAITAELAAWRAKHKIERPVILRDGVKAERNAAAEALFSLPPIRRKGKVIGVETRRAKA